MAEIYQVLRNGERISLDDLSSIKKGEVFRVGVPGFPGRWRTAAMDAKPGNKKGTWQVQPIDATGRSNGYNGR